MGFTPSLATLYGKFEVAVLLLFSSPSSLIVAASISMAMAW